jgi:hypothetical protein
MISLSPPICFTLVFRRKLAANWEFQLSRIGGQDFMFFACRMGAIFGSGFLRSGESEQFFDVCSVGWQRLFCHIDG